MRSLFAALTLFTRLPFFARWARPQDFARAVEWWPAVGLATGGVMASVLWLARLADFPPMAAAAMALGARVLLTGAFHEDGLGDFFDGFGGGRTRERTLEIMKDSRTGSYGVVGLALYFLVAASLVSELGVAVVFAGDVLCKAVAGQLVNILPYARPAADSKVGAYRRMGAVGWVVSAAAILVAVLALGFGAFAGLFPTRMWWAVAVPVTVLAGLAWLMRRRIGGYTGDCCGATFLLCEVAFWMAIWLV